MFSAVLLSLLILFASEPVSDALRFTSQAIVDGQLQQSMREASKLFAEIDRTIAPENAMKEHTDVDMSLFSRQAHDTAQQSGDDSEQKKQVDEAQERLSKVQRHFEEVDKLFAEKLKEADKVRELGQELTPQAKRALELAHQDAVAAQRDVDSAVAELEDVRVDADKKSLSKGEAEQHVREAQVFFSKANQDFEQQLQELSERESRGDEISNDERNALARAQDDARRAQHKLDRVLEALRVPASTEGGTSIEHDEAIAPGDGAAAREEPDVTVAFQGVLSEAEQQLTEVQEHFNQDRKSVV